MKLTDKTYNFRNLIIIKPGIVVGDYFPIYFADYCQIVWVSDFILGNQPGTEHTETICPFISTGIGEMLFPLLNFIWVILFDA